MFLTQIDPAFLAGEGGGTPALDLFFSATKALDSRITFVRASVGTYIDSTGALQTASSGAARFTHDPVTLDSLGLLVEESRINILLNSATLSTQSVTTTATAYTLSFTGTGTITLSGTSTAGPLVGTGTGEANRVALTFTPTAGTLTLTVSGTVTNAQLETGQFRTSYIPTTGSQATRAADVVTMTGTNFSSWYNQTEGTLAVNARLDRGLGGSGRAAVSIDNGISNRITIGNSSADAVCNFGVVSGGSFQYSPTLSNIWTSGLTRGAALAYISGATRGAANGTLAPAGTGSVPIGVNQLTIGALTTSTTPWCGTISRIRYYRRRLPDASLQALTT